METNLETAIRELKDEVRFRRERHHGHARPRLSTVECELLIEAAEAKLSVTKNKS